MENRPKFRPDPVLKLMDQVRQVLRYHHYAYRTEQTYCDWITRFIRFFDARHHPKDMGKKEIEAFLSHLATKGKVAAATQKQVLNALVFLYKNVLEQISGTHLFLAQSLCSGGRRLMGCIRLRIQDLDSGRNLIHLRAAKGGKERTVFFTPAIHRQHHIMN